MHWNQISFEVNNQQADLVSEVLMGLGSISISYSDGQDNAIFEPPFGETPLWESIQVKALFQSEVDINLVAETLSEGWNIKIIDSLKVEDKIWEEECQKDFPSMQFGKNLWVCPSWDSKKMSSEDANHLTNHALVFGFFFFGSDVQLNLLEVCRIAWSCICLNMHLAK